MTTFRKTKKRTLSFQRVENRELMAGDAYAALSNDGVLMVAGTDHDDTIVIDEISPRLTSYWGGRLSGSYTGGFSLVSSTGTQIKVSVTTTEHNGVTRNKEMYFNKAEVDMIHADGGKYTDHIHNNTDLPAELIGGHGYDKLRGGYGNDTLVGGSGKDDLRDYRGGNNFFKGEEGDDYLRGSNDGDTLWGGGGDDTIYGYGGHDTIYSSSNTYHDRDFVDGGSGNDTIHGSYGDDTLHGSTGDDEIRGRDGDDEIFGGSDNDSLFGGGGSDTLEGGGGNDHLEGFDNVASLWHDEADFLYGGSGNDVLVGDADGAGDVLKGGSGYDDYFYELGDYIDDDGLGGYGWMIQNAEYQHSGDYEGLWFKEEGLVAVTSGWF